MQTLHTDVANPNIIIAMKHLLILGLMYLSLGFSQSLPEGSELLLTDLNSQVIVGHGKIFAGQLYLKLSQKAEGFFLYVLSSDGNVATHHGEARGNLVGVFTDQGELISLEQVLAGRGVKLIIERVEILADQIPSDDALLETNQP